MTDTTDIPKDIKRLAEFVQILNEARCYSPRVIGNMELANRIVSSDAIAAQDAEIAALKAQVAGMQKDRFMEPVGWQWLTTSSFRRKLPAHAERGAWRRIYAEKA